MRGYRRPGAYLLAASALALCGCGGGGSELSGTAAAGVTAAIASYYDGLRRGDLAAVQAAFAPDYDYDRGNLLFDPRDPFDRPGSLSYSSLQYRVEALVETDNTVSATVRTTFKGRLNLSILGLGEPAVSGDSRTLLELETRGAEWKLTAVRPLRITYLSDPLPPLPDTINPVLVSTLDTLPGYNVNGQTSLEVAPGERLRLAGRSVAAAEIVGLVESSLHRESQDVTLDTFDVPLPWALDFTAPGPPGRYLAYAISLVGVPGPAPGEVSFVGSEVLTIPVSVRGAE